MQVVANQQLVKNRARLGMGLHLAALAIFAIGLFVTSRPQNVTEALPIWSWASILVGMVFYVLGQTQLRRWGPRNRAASALGEAIRSLDDRYKLYAYLTSNLPDYILVGPGGVQVLVPKNESGTIRCQRDKWSRLGTGKLLSLLDNSLGNPSADAQRAVARVRETLQAENLGDVPVSALVVFTHPNVQLQVEGCSATVTRLKGLKDVLRKAAGKGQNVALGGQHLRQVQAVFDRRMQTAPAWR